MLIRVFSICEIQTVAWTCLPVCSFRFSAPPISARPTIECRRRLISVSGWTTTCWSAFRRYFCSSLCCGSCTAWVPAAPCRGPFVAYMDCRFMRVERLGLYISTPTIHDSETSLTPRADTRWQRLFTCTQK